MAQKITRPRYELVSPHGTTACDCGYVFSRQGDATLDKGRKLTEGRISTTTATLYGGTDQASAVLVSLTKGTRFEPMGFHGTAEMGWCRVRTDDRQVGYILDSLSEVLEECEVMAETLSIYRKDKKSEIRMPHGAHLLAWLSLPELYGSDTGLVEVRYQDSDYKVGLGLEAL